MKRHEGDENYTEMMAAGELVNEVKLDWYILNWLIK